jgi:hypothetical protein
MNTDENGHEQVPASSWNFRVMEFTSVDGGTFRAIHEVYYSNGVLQGYTKDPAVVMWDPNDADDGAFLVLQRMHEALSKPVLTVTDFGTPETKPTTSPGDQ